MFECVHWCCHPKIFPLVFWLLLMSLSASSWITKSVVHVQSLHQYNEEDHNRYLSSLLSENAMWSFTAHSFLSTVEQFPINGCFHPISLDNLHKYSVQTNARSLFHSSNIQFHISYRKKVLGEQKRTEYLIYPDVQLSKGNCARLQWAESLALKWHLSTDNKWARNYRFGLFGMQLDDTPFSQFHR